MQDPLQSAVMFDWNPITIKRWQRFRRMRRAWWSLWILASLYILSLISEVICNNTPLLIRFNDHYFIPLVHFYPEDTFLQNGRQTRPDYKWIQQQSQFLANPENFMFFPPIPYGPYENASPASISTPEVVKLSFRAEPHVASISVSPEFRITKSANPEFFIGMTADSLKGQSFTNFYKITPALTAAISARLQNQAAPALSVTSISAYRSIETELTLSEYTPRETAPPSIRLTLREKTDKTTAPEGTVGWNARLQLAASSFSLWPSLSPEVQSNFTALAVQCLSNQVPTSTFDIQGTPYLVTATKTEVRWPYPPVASHWLGLDSSGRDVLARIVYGFRTSLTFGFLLVILAMVLGTALGAIQGYFGHHVDIIGQRFTEIWSALPFLYVMILLGAVYGRGFTLLLVCYALFNWIGISYYIRAEFLRLRHLPFVEAARSLGLPHRTIIFRHILPNAIIPLVTFFPFNLVGAIGSLAALDYLGFGLPPPTPSWGELLQQAQQFRWAWWLILYPALALFLVMLLGVFVGEGIRNVYDPRPQTKFE